MASSPSTLQSSSPTRKTSLDLSSLPPIFLFHTHLDTEDLHEIEDQITECGGALTYDISEAKVILSKAEGKRRIELDLRGKGIFTERVATASGTCTSTGTPRVGLVEPLSKRRRLAQDREAIGDDDKKFFVIDDEHSTASEAEEDARAQPEPVKRTPSPSPVTDPPKGLLYQFSGDAVKVLRLRWFEDCLQAGNILPIESYLSYEGRTIAKPESAASNRSTSETKLPPPKTILERAKADAPAQTSFHNYRPHGQRSRQAIVTSGTSFGHGTGESEKRKYAHLLHETTSEHDETAATDLPEMPQWVKRGVKYACQRITPAESPNKDFIDLLDKIRLARLLTLDEIGVRAYSTSIASLKAYPHAIHSPREILAIPGCDVKIANLFVEFSNTGRLRAADDAEANEDLQILRLFYNIWGVGATTARDFYYSRGWRDLDDVVEFGWSTLSRVQQIGVKFYTEFLELIPRAEVERIADVILRHARRVRDDRVQGLVVGGYRRGKAESGDVDIIVSHPDEDQTLNIVNDIVASLEREGWITHTLLLALTSSQRGQQTLPYRSEGRGGGFDTLDKALVVWQDPEWPSKAADLAANPKAKNPNVHRRVDIIISPWRTVGCAVMGWSGGTTFQRDLRRYAKSVKGWKFDSSGIRDRAGGKVVDAEGWEDVDRRATDMVQAEKRVFETFGLEWREPWERCTG